MIIHNLKNTLVFLLLLQLITFLNAATPTLNDLKSLKIVPQIYLESNFSIVDNSSAVKTLSYVNNFYRFDDKNFITVWNVLIPGNQTLKCNITSPFTIYDIAIDYQYGHFAYIDANKTLKIFNPTDCSQNSTLVLNYSTVNSSIFISYAYVIVLFSTKASQRGNNRGFRYYRNDLNFWRVVSYEFPEVQGNQLKYSHCSKPIIAGWGLGQFIVAYNQQSYLQIYGYWSDDYTLTYLEHQYKIQPDNLSWSIKSMSWDFDCGFIYLVYKPPTNKVKIIYHDKMPFINQLTYPIEIQSAFSFDQKKWILAVFLSNNSILLYNVSGTTMSNTTWGQVNTIKPLPFLNQKITYQIQQLNSPARGSFKVFLTTQTYTQIYKIACPSGITLGMGLCFDQFQSQINNNSQFLMVFFKAVKLMALIISLMQVTPFASFFLRFINFWTICSLYSMVNIQTAQPLTSLLYEIYNLINASLFDLIGLSFSVQISHLQKVTDKYSEYYGITSNFAPIIIQPVVCTAIMFVILYMFEWIKHNYFSQNNKKKFSTNKIKIFFGQYVSFLSVFMFPLKFVFLSLYQEQYLQKVNLYLHILFIWLGFMLPFLMIFLNSIKLKAYSRTHKKMKTIGFFTQKSIKTEQNKSVKIIKQNVSVLTFQYLQFTYICLVNIFMPVLGTISNPCWFAILCGFLILLGIFIDSKKDELRVNSIIMSTQLLIFHLSFCLLIFDLSTRMRYIISVVSMGVLMIGATHELLTLAFVILTSVYSLFCFNRTAKVSQDTKNVKKQKQQGFKQNYDIQKDAVKQNIRGTMFHPSIKLKSSLKLKNKTKTKNMINVQQMIHENDNKLAQSSKMELRKKQTVFEKGQNRKKFLSMKPTLASKSALKIEKPKQPDCGSELNLQDHLYKASNKRTKNNQTTYKMNQQAYNQSQRQQQLQLDQVLKNRKNIKVKKTTLRAKFKLQYKKDQNS